VCSNRLPSVASISGTNMATTAAARNPAAWQSHTRRVSAKIVNTHNEKTSTVKRDTKSRPSTSLK
jgi:hypothetical protein